MQDLSVASASHRRVAFGLIVIGILARFLPHPPNVTPLTAMALFGGAALSAGWAVGLPLITVILSDMVIGLHDVVAFTWSAFALTGLLGWWLRRQPSAGHIVLASAAGSTLFFLVSNFGVWLIGDAGTMYPKTLQGLWLCYEAALPFFRNALIGDVVYTVGIFGVYAWCAGRVAIREPVRSPS